MVIVSLVAGEEQDPSTDQKAFEAIAPGKEREKRGEEKEIEGLSSSQTLLCDLSGSSAEKRKG